MPELDPVKVAAFERGWHQMERDNAHDAKVTGATMAVGAAVGAGLGSVIPGAGTAAGFGIGTAAGFCVGIAIVAFEKLTHSGYYAGR